MIARQLDLEGLHNIRDLGGLPLGSGLQTRFGALYRGCAMEELTPRGRQALAARGIATLIDLRSARERQESLAKPPPLPEAMSHHVPLFDTLAPVYKAANSSRGFCLTDRYAEALHRAAPRFATAITLLANAPAGAVLFHCTAGKDRTGLVAALLLSLAGVERDAIIADYHQSVTDGLPYIARLGRKSRARKTAPRLLAQMLAAPPETMAATLDLLDREYGGAGAYLSAAGVGAATLQRAATRITG